MTKQLKLARTVHDTKVRIKRSGEIGNVTGFCQYKHVKQNQFFVEYLGNDGRALQDWFHEDELEVLE